LSTLIFKFNLESEHIAYLTTHDASKPDVYQEWLNEYFAEYYGETVLEVGGGSGKVTNFLRKVLPESTSLTTIEPGKEMIPVLKKNTKDLDVEIIEGTLRSNFDTLKKKKFDTIVYINVLEHIEDDIEELRKCRELLTDGGRILIFVPAMEQLYSPRDLSVGHYRRYHYKEMRRKFKIAGFHIDKLTYFDRVGAILWWGKFVLLNSNKIGGGQVSFYNKIIIPISKLIDRIAPLPMGKNIIAVGRK
jgi:SAM-dependent methyltransferase